MVDDIWKVDVVHVLQKVYAVFFHKKKFIKNQFFDDAHITWNCVYNSKCRIAQYSFVCNEQT